MKVVFLFLFLFIYIIIWSFIYLYDLKKLIIFSSFFFFGKNDQTIVWEMNRLGMMIDLSHVSHNVMREVLNATKAPIIFSHSSAYQICNHHRNVPDDVLDLVVIIWFSFNRYQPNYLFKINFFFSVPYIYYSSKSSINFNLTKQKKLFLFFFINYREIITV